MSRFSQAVEPDLSTPGALARLRVEHYPIGMMPKYPHMVTVRLVEALAAERGWDIDNIEVECDGYVYTGATPRRVRELDGGK